MVTLGSYTNVSLRQKGQSVDQTMCYGVKYPYITSWPTTLPSNPQPTTHTGHLNPV